MSNTYEIFGFLGAAASIVAACYSLFNAYVHTRYKGVHNEKRKMSVAFLSPGVPLGIDPGTVAMGGNGESIEDDNLANLSYRLVRERRYRSIIMLARHLNLDNLGASHEHLTFLVNLAQAYKWSGARDECEKILGMAIWRNIDDRGYLLAHLVLREKFQDAGDVMERIPTERINKEAYVTWPLFKEFRKTERFRQAYQALFDEFPPT